MSFAIIVSPEPPVSPAVAAVVASAFDERVGVRMTGARGNSFVFIDDGDLSKDSYQGLLLLLEPLRAGFVSLVDDLLERAAAVTFHAGWLGDAPGATRPITSAAFARELHAGEIQEGVLYRISR